MENAFSLEDIRPSILKIKIKGKLLPVMLTAGFKKLVSFKFGMKASKA